MSRFCDHDGGDGCTRNPPCETVYSWKCACGASGPGKAPEDHKRHTEADKARWSVRQRLEFK